MRKEEGGLFEAITTAIMQSLRDTHTILIARVEVVGLKTIDVKPVISREVDGVKIDLPLFKSVPPVFLQGGGSYTAHPISVGDYCLLLVNERCFDLWYHGQDFNTPLEKRIMDYSDSFALVGVNTLSGAITIPSVITTIGDAYLEGNYTHIGNLNITGDINVTGNIEASGTITGNTDVIAGGVSVKNHTHTGDSGGSTSTPN